jgi:hypothetical protein
MTPLGKKISFLKFAQKFLNLINLVFDLHILKKMAHPLVLLKGF